ncbi:hypothetical protein [Candidatus Nitrotoga sp. M5]|uniref:hypothetical protein n=1 Tax=Candidatus Nitrotoga sp. M5 TaxID=2890409 RepID=UPI001EF4B1DF|nr:hypothetical protein [Candidatus Nitrotoga sp. M5]
MKRILFAAMLVTIAAPALSADVGVSISLGQPGFYGQIDIGNHPKPQLIYRTPVIIQPMPMGRMAQPVYLRVPPGHRKNWRKHCHRYGACGQQVYFVRQDWYNNVYIPSYHAHGNRRGGHARNHGSHDRNYYRNHDGGHARAHFGHDKNHGGKHAKSHVGHDKNYYKNHDSRHHR